MERFVRAVGICTLVLILLIGISTIALTLLPKRGFRAELFSALRSGLKALVDKLEGVKGTPDSPIVVRGGSMTIRTRDPGGWVDEGNKSWCSDIPDLAYFAIVPEPTTVSPPTSFPDGSKLTINVRAGSSDDLQNGIQLVSQSGGCTENDQSPSSIKLSLIDNASSDFYPYSSSVNQEGGGKRWRRDSGTRIQSMLVLARILKVLQLAMRTYASGHLELLGRYRALPPTTVALTANVLSELEIHISCIKLSSDSAAGVVSWAPRIAGRFSSSRHQLHPKRLVLQHEHANQLLQALCLCLPVFLKQLLLILKSSHLIHGFSPPREGPRTTAFTLECGIREQFVPKNFAKGADTQVNLPGAHQGSTRSYQLRAPATR